MVQCVKRNVIQAKDRRLPMHIHSKFKGAHAKSLFPPENNKFTHILYPYYGRLDCMHTSL